MSRMVGTVSRGLRAPIIREGDDLVKIVTETVLARGLISYLTFHMSLRGKFSSVRKNCGNCTYKLSPAFFVGNPVKAFDNIGILD